MTWPTRDSIVWWIGILGGACVALAAHEDLFPWLPAWAQHASELIGFLWAVTSGKLATSPLQGAPK